MFEFATKGYQDFVINELCKVDGISKGVLYHNFSGKSDLNLTCFQESFEKALAVFLGVEGQVPSLADYMERRHQFYQQYPEHSHIFFESMIATPEELEADIAPQKAIFLDLNEQVCQKLISESKLKEHIDEKRAMDYLRLIQDMFRSYYLTVSSDSSLPDLVSGYEHQLSQVLDMMISMTFLFALVFAVQGISEIVQYFKSEEKHGWNLFGGIVTLILALTLFSGSFIEMVTFVPFIISLWALTNGITKTIVGFKVRKTDKSVGTPLVWMGILGIVAGLIMMGHPLMTGLYISYTIAFVFIYQGIVAIVQFFKIK